MGGAPNAKPKESAGKPAGADAGAGPGSSGPAGGVTPNGAPAEESGPVAKVGVPDVGEGTPSGQKFSLKPKGPRDIETVLYRTKKNVEIVGFKAKMAIDGDGPGGAKDGDPKYQKETSLRLTPGGTSLNARIVPFIVIPGNFKDAHPNVKLGDYAVVTYNNKSLYALVGDVGPDHVLGEGSPALARGVGIDPDPVRGGLETANVEYKILPGSKSSQIPSTSWDVQKNASMAFEAAGAGLK
jgi:hypothetical protein